MRIAASCATLCRAARRSSGMGPIPTPHGAEAPGLRPAGHGSFHIRPVEFDCGMTGSLILTVRI